MDTDILLPELSTQPSGSRRGQTDTGQTQDIDRRRLEKLLADCRKKDFESLRDVLKSESDLSQQRWVDAEGNTALHALFCDCDEGDTGSFDATEFWEIFQLLLDTKLVDCSSENCFNRNCFHACSLQEPQLKEILEEAKQKNEIQEAIGKMLTNSQGMHAVHAFACRYSMETILSPLAAVSGLTEQELLRLTVSTGSNKGATCLHFACQAGHEENIGYLIGENLSLSATTESGQSCIDFAYDKGKVRAVSEAAKDSKVSQLDILRLVDVTKRAVKLPESLAARRQLASFTDAEVRTEAEQPHSQLDMQLRQQGQEDKEEKTLNRILYRAVELDSPEIIRSLLSLDMLDSAKADRFAQYYLPRKVNVRNTNLSDENQKIDCSDYKELLQKCKESGYQPSVIDVCVQLKRLVIIPDLLLIRQFDLIPTCMKLLLQLQPKIKEKGLKHEQLLELRSKAESMLVNALNELHNNGNVEQRHLLFRFLNGNLENERQVTGPKYRWVDSQQMPVLQIVEQLDRKDLFATDCLHNLARKEWNGEDFGKRNSNEVDAVECVRSCKPKIKFVVNSAFLFIFLLYFAWFLAYFTFTFDSWVWMLLLTAFAVSHLFQEINDFCRSCYSLGTLRYFKDLLNVIDFVSLVLMWTGIMWDWSIFSAGVTHPTSYGCLMIQATSFLLLGFRSVAMLSIFEKIGPVISMLRQLLIRDLLPFMAILFVIFYSFGVFFVNLLFPVITASAADTNSTHYRLEVLQQVFTLPAFLMFGFFEKTNFESEAVQQIGKSPHPTGQMLFYLIPMFLFLLLVNIVMLNLLIALFNLTVSRMEGRAKVIWRKRYYEMLREYESMSIVPPPLSFVAYSCRFVRFVLKQRLQCCAAKSEDANEWWCSEDSYKDCEEFMQFLQYQAFQFRRLRPLLTRAVTSNRGDFEQLKASNENSMTAMLRDIEERMNQADEKLDEKLNEKLARMDKKLNEKLELLLSHFKLVKG